jgi:predicted Zn-dependent protease with MMP-like domain
MMQVPRGRFDALVAEALDSLPVWVTEHMDNVEVTTEEHPPPDQPHLLGLYHGIPLTNRSPIGYSGVLPDRIVLYRSTICAEARDEDELEAVIRRVVAHEIAHYFGISDTRLRELDAY